MHPTTPNPSTWITEPQGIVMDGPIQIGLFAYDDSGHASAFSSYAHQRDEIWNKGSAVACPSILGGSFLANRILRQDPGRSSEWAI